ncbi:helix-turn-helix transcriptional regulator [Saccharomonospora sp. CUA-673]|uniref:helix-turn-helix domain-containing protein n=1 Tax=Saccharomonospora sp. CUA-673 TaxID=1904969 RepID=UPI0021006E6A|nr:helix-turn-helix transcriptional regulator [Saccharomonospora sp. CUA-673]
MAARTHYSKALLGHLETGKRVVRPEHVTAYSRALNVSTTRCTAAQTTRSGWLTSGWCPIPRSLCTRLLVDA